MDRKDGSGVLPIRIMPPPQHQFDGGKTAMPIVEMDNIRSRSDPSKQGQGGMIEEGEPFVVLGVSVDRVAMEQ